MPQYLMLRAGLVFCWALQTQKQRTWEDTSSLFRSTYPICSHSPQHLCLCSHHTEAHTGMCVPTAALGTAPTPQLRVPASRSSQKQQKQKSSRAQSPSYLSPMGITCGSSLTERASSLLLLPSQLQPLLTLAQGYSIPSITNIPEQQQHRATTLSPALPGQAHLTLPH